MGRFLRFIIIAAALFAVVLGNCMVVFTQSCSRTLRFRNTTRKFAICIDLKVQGATLAWTLDQQNHVANITFSGTAPSSSGWVGWGINPTELEMSGTSSFIAFTASNGSNLLPYKLTDATLAYSPLVCSPIDFVLLDKDVQISGPTMSMFVSLKLRPNQTILNHVWNRGSSVSQFQPGPHKMSGDGTSGLIAINMISGSALNVQSGSSRQTLKNVGKSGILLSAPGWGWLTGGDAFVSEYSFLLGGRHGILNTIAWGILLPVGVMHARYMQPFTNAAWFYFHISFQCAGYIIGVAGWATGIKLGTSEREDYDKHRDIGLALFVLSTLQVTALLLRPDKKHKFRKYWNLYHHAVGYVLIILGISNILKGFDILSPANKWRQALYGVLGTLGGIIVALEIVTWVMFIKKKGSSAKKQRSVDDRTCSQGLETGL